MISLLSTISLLMQVIAPAALDFTSSNKQMLIEENPRFEKVFRFIESNDLSKLAPGKYDIDGEESWLMIQEVSYDIAQKRRLEVHNEYIDMQFPLTSAEQFGIRNRNKLTLPDGPYQPDILFYKDKFDEVVTVNPGQFIVFTPDWAHASNIGSSFARKAVVKVRWQLPESKEKLFKLCDSLSMETPVIRPFTRKDKKKYSIKALDYGMTIGIERTPKGRIWNCFVGGGDNADAYFILNWSDNGGKTFSDTKFIIDPHDEKLPFKRRTIVGQLWTDPKGRLWLFMDQAMTYYDGRATNWYSICENPDDRNPVWSKPRLLGFGCTLNKPTVMSTGEWCLPVSIWCRSRINVAKEKDWTESPLASMHHELDDVRGAHIFVSTDEGKNWEDRSFVNAPKPSFDEHIITELTDGRWWMTLRTGIGICQSFSSDRGYSWTKPTLYQPHVNSRHFILRLQSGKLLLVRHGMTNKRTKKRSHMRAFLSEDDGLTWKGGLLIDERSGISYPSGYQDPEGYVMISYDYERSKCGELYLAKFNEEDILAKKVVSKEGYLGKMFYKPGRIKL